MGEVKTYKCSNQTYFSPFYQMCVHPSIANCFKHFPLSSNLFPYLQSIYTINDSNEKQATPIMANYRLMPNLNITITNSSLSFKSNDSSYETTAYSNLNSTTEFKTSSILR
jgi:hypothetical protein